MNVKKRSAWLITWESSRDDYLADLRRPRVVAILRPQLSPSTIAAILPVLFISESKLTFSEKICYGLLKRPRRWVRHGLRRICCGPNPWLEARLVKDLYVEKHPDSDFHQTLHWTEYPNRSVEPTDGDPHRLCMEEAHFDCL